MFKNCMQCVVSLPTFGRNHERRKCENRENYRCVSIMYPYPVVTTESHQLIKLNTHLLSKEFSFVTNCNPAWMCGHSF